jgi:manganese/iron transport system substrate-binding protein
MTIDRRFFSSILGLVMLAGCSQSTTTTTTSSPSTSPASTSSPASSPSSNNANRPKVVATNSTVCDLTKQIAGETIDLKCPIAAGTDPHVYKVTSGDRQSFEAANVILYGGYDFEHDLVKVIQSNKSPKVEKIAVFEQAVPKPLMFEEDGKSTQDPHVFHDASHGAKMVEIIQTALVKAAPERQAEYIANAKKIQTELTQLDGWIRSQIATIPANSKTLITTHDALGYFSKAYSIPVDAIEGVSTEEKPNAAKVKAVIDRIKKSQVPTIFAEVSVNPKLIQTVAKDAKVKVSESEIFADGLGTADSPASTYQQMLIANTKSIVTGLGGNYTPFQAK